jgi:hypothetical protein
VVNSSLTFPKGNQLYAPISRSTVVIDLLCNETDKSAYYRLNAGNPKICA